MKLITRNTDYAVRALVFIAGRKGALIPASDLVSRLKIPRPFLRKILQILNREGLLISIRGQAGGFRLAVRPQRIFITDLINIFQGPFKLNECTLKKHICPNTKECVLKKKIDAIGRYVASELRSITIASLVKEGGRRDAQEKDHKDR
ncbi:MAG: Rrf2 family transcriptional regulator [Candidatus Omnitrophica bacterium]|nr:Rrf2 family transcriptional regulator [Candidatus Omnitrophota bacterium]